MSPTPQLISVKDAAKTLGICLTSAWKLVTDEPPTLETVRIGNRRLVRVSSLNKIIEHGATVPPNPPKKPA